MNEENTETKPDNNATPDSVSRVVRIDFGNPAIAWEVRDTIPLKWYPHIEWELINPIKTEDHGQVHEMPTRFFFRVCFGVFDLAIIFSDHV